MAVHLLSLGNIKLQVNSNRQRKGSEPRAKVFLVDDHEVIRLGISQLINHQPDLIVCGQASEASPALKAIAEGHPNLVVSDISLEGGDGLELVKNLRAQYPTLPILVLSMHDETLYGELALHAGARGYVSKSSSGAVILAAIRKVLQGGVYLSDNLSGAMLMKQVGRQTQSPSSPVERLSARELQVFQLIGQWKGTRVIAQELHLSIKTVEYYREQIKQKLNLKNASQLLQAARQRVESGHLA